MSLAEVIRITARIGHLTRIIEVTLYPTPQVTVYSGLVNHHPRTIIIILCAQLIIIGLPFRLVDLDGSLVNQRVSCRIAVTLGLGESASRGHKGSYKITSVGVVHQPAIRENGQESGQPLCAIAAPLLGGRSYMEFRVKSVNIGCQDIAFGLACCITGVIGQCQGKSICPYLPAPGGFE